MQSKIYKPSNKYRLFDFGFVSKNIKNIEIVSCRVSQDEVFSYIYYAFEHSTEKNLTMVPDTVAVFACGLTTNENAQIYCIFRPNRTNKEPWYLAALESESSIGNIGCALPEPIDDIIISEFTMKFEQFAYVSNDQWCKFADTSFDGDVVQAKQHISEIFPLSNKYGYIDFHNDKLKAIFATGIVSTRGNRIFALFNKNTGGNSKKPWICAGFFPQDLVFDIPNFPLPVAVSIPFTEESVNSTTITEFTTSSKKKTLLVTAISLEYNVLKDVLLEKKIDFEEQEIDVVGNKKLKHLFSSALNLFAIEAGVSFKCVLPLIQSILAFEPDRAILTGIAFSFNSSKAKVGYVIGSQQLFDYESAKVNDGDEIRRGDKISCSQPLKALFTNTKHGHNIREEWGLFASGMKVVNSKEFINTLKDGEPELLAGDMEGFFFSNTCQTLGVDWVVVKGISDVGVGKSDEDQKMASYNAISRVISVISQN